MTRSTWALGALALLASLGCSGEDDPAAEQPLDQRVVDGMLPVSGDSMESRRWLDEQLVQLKMPFVADCLEAAGYPELVAVAEADFEQFRETYSAEFPEPESILRDGLNPDRGPVAYQGRDRGSGASSASVAQDEAYYGCTREPELADPAARRADELFRALFDQWTPIVIDHVRGASVDEAAEVAFGACLRAGGVPEEFTESEAPAPGYAPVPLEDRYRAWVTQRVQSGTVSLTAIEDAPLFVECGRPIWDARQAALLARREPFVDEHRDQLAELSGLVSDA